MILGEVSKSGPPQSSFIGIAFRVKDDKKHDLVHFRTFNFRAADPARRSHAVQYVCEPEWTLHRLRKERTGQYEKPIDPAPDGDAWFHAKITIENSQAKTYVNREEEPSLTVAPKDAPACGQRSHGI